MAGLGQRLDGAHDKEDRARLRYVGMRNPSVEPVGELCLRVPCRFLNDGGEGTLHPLHEVDLDLALVAHVDQARLAVIDDLETVLDRGGVALVEPLRQVEEVLLREKPQLALSPKS